MRGGAGREWGDWGGGGRGLREGIGAGCWVQGRVWGRNEVREAEGLSPVGLWRAVRGSEGV